MHLSDLNDVDAKKFSGLIDSLKDLRNSADYGNILINDKEAKAARRLANTIIKILKNNYPSEEDE